MSVDSYRFTVNKKCSLTACAQNDPDIDFLFTEQLPLKGQRGSRGKPWMVAGLPRWLFVSLQLLISGIIFRSAWVKYHWTVKRGCCCCRDHSRSCFRGSQQPGVRDFRREWPQRPYHGGAESMGERMGGKARTNMITDATRLNPGIRIQSVPVGVTITLKNSYLHFLTAGFWAQLVNHEILEGRALELAPKIFGIWISQVGWKGLPFDKKRGEKKKKKEEEMKGGMFSFLISQVLKLLKARDPFNCKIHFTDPYRQISLTNIIQLFKY